MTARAALPFTPRLMKAPKAAAYLDMSETKFRELVAAGRIAKPSDQDGLIRWDTQDLDAYADALREGRSPANDWSGIAL